MAYATEFEQTKIVRAEPTDAYDVWAAIWSNRRRGQVMIAAPTLDALQARWEQITHSDFDRSIAMHLVLAKWISSDSASASQE